MSDVMDKGHEWLEEHRDQLFAFGEGPKHGVFYGTDEDFEGWLARIKALATGGDAPPPLAPRPHTGGIIGAIIEHMEGQP